MSLDSAIQMPSECLVQQSTVSADSSYIPTQIFTGLFCSCLTNFPLSLHSHALLLFRPWKLRYTSLPSASHTEQTVARLAFPQCTACFSTGSWTELAPVLRSTTVEIFLPFPPPFFLCPSEWMAFYNIAVIRLLSSPFSERMPLHRRFGNEDYI